MTQKRSRVATPPPEIEVSFPADDPTGEGVGAKMLLWLERMYWTSPECRAVVDAQTEVA